MPGKRENRRPNPRPTTTFAINRVLEYDETIMKTGQRMVL